MKCHALKEKLGGRGLRALSGSLPTFAETGCEEE